VSELIRILIEPERLTKNKDGNNNINIEEREFHYLSRVMRLKTNDKLLVLDGCGNLWTVAFTGFKYLKIISKLQDSILLEKRKLPFIGLAVVIPKKGFEDILRMTTEIGVDKIQPLISYRSDVKITNLKDRWRSIIRESFEISERLWQPILYEPISFHDWLKTKKSNSLYSIAATRQPELTDLKSSLDISYKKQDIIWIAIGPEGGWTNNELLDCKDSGFKFVKLGDSILRTSTAAIAAINSISSWRDSR
tara:strand:+ start:230 stop:979 length:750 start_codon:yes stop_codon:yes gene_type:complete